jgi:predicted nucleotidyltransferase
MEATTERTVPIGTGIPDQVSQGLDRFVKAAEDALGATLKSVVLFGSAAEGRLRNTSDVNVLLILSAWDDARADTLREPLRAAQAAFRLAPMFVLEQELEAAAQAFPVKFADIQRRRQVLLGADPLVKDLVPRDAEIVHLRQVLLNLVLRLRERYLMVSLREEQAARALAEAAGPLRSGAASILELEGKPAASARDALATLSGQIRGEDWGEVLSHISAAREGKSLPPGAASTSLRRLVALAQGLLERSRNLR